MAKRQTTNRHLPANHDNKVHNKRQEKNFETSDNNWRKKSKRGGYEDGRDGDTKKHRKKTMYNRKERCLNGYVVFGKNLIEWYEQALENNMKR